MSDAETNNDGGCNVIKSSSSSSLPSQKCGFFQGFLSNLGLPSFTKNKNDDVVEKTRRQGTEKRPDPLRGFAPHEKRVLRRAYQTLASSSCSEESLSDTEERRPLSVRLASVATTGDDVADDSADAEARRKRSLFVETVERVQRDVLPPDRDPLLELVRAPRRSDDGSFSAAVVDEEEFARRVANWLGRGDDRLFALRVLFFCSSDGPVPTEETDSATAPIVEVDAVRLTDLCYRLAVAVHVLDELVDGDEPSLANEERPPPIVVSDSVTAALARSLSLAKTERCDQDTNPPPFPSPPSSPPTLGADKVSFQTFVRWHDSKFPYLSVSLSAFLRRILFPRVMPGFDYPPLRMFPEFPPDVRDSLLFSRGNATSVNPLTFALANASKNLRGKWHRLFTSDVDGLSFNRLQLALMGYDGPTVLVIRESSDAGAVFGAYTASRWRESEDFYGGDGDGDCFLFSLEPRLSVLRPGPRSRRNFQFCRGTGTGGGRRRRGATGGGGGVGFGGTVERPRLSLSETLENCRATSRDTTFEEGPLLPGNATTFDAECVEVWGVGGDDVVRRGLGARDLHRAVADASLSKARRVDRAQFLDDFRSGLIESKAFAHREQMRNREGGQ